MIPDKSNTKRHLRIKPKIYIQIFNPKTRNWVKFCDNSDKTILDNNRIDTINFKTPMSSTKKRKEGW